jgi:RND family efflux transporter MFP subunit
VTVSGITEPMLDAILSTPVAGIIAGTKFQEGDAVKKGDPLVDLDRRIEELDVARRKAVFEQSRNEFQITKTLFEKPNSSTPKVDVEKRELEYNVARVEYELAQEQLKRRQVAAPFDGVIAELFLETGEACQAQQPLVRLVDARQCYFVCNVESRAGHHLRTGTQVDLEIEAGASPVKVTGLIRFVSPVVDAASGLLKVKAVFENPGGAIRPGVAGKMTLPAAP